MKESDFDVGKEPMPTIEDGQVLVQNIYLSLDPTHRIWASDRPQYMPCVEIGEVMRAGGVGVVKESKNAEYPVGTYVSVFGGVCDYFQGIPGVNVMGKIDTSNGIPLTAHVSVLSLIVGLTAWYGTRKVLNVQKDDVVCISGASGAVGSLVGQLSKVSGATVIGIAGGPEKCKNLKNMGFDVAIDYKNQNVDEELKKAAPDGVTCYFDNVGGNITETVLENFRNFGRFAYCGSISEYNDKDANGISNFNMILMRRITVTGFICLDLADHMPEAMTEIGGLLSEGKIKYAVDVRKVGVEHYVESVNALFDGTNTGKLMMQISEEK
jgi:NADPH-dependent curcumin reductase CurA